VAGIAGAPKPKRQTCMPAGESEEDRWFVGTSYRIDLRLLPIIFSYNFSFQFYIFVFTQQFFVVYLVDMF
jgi:hypothetical protein